jgi:hypothetical protein
MVRRLALFGRLKAENIMTAETIRAVDVWISPRGRPGLVYPLFPLPRGTGMCAFSRCLCIGLMGECSIDLHHERSIEVS